MKSVLRMCAVMLIMVVVAGCGADEATQEPRFANWPAMLNDFRFRWAAAPGIDLASGPAVPLRAYLESYRIWSLTQDAEATYPGFDRAVPGALSGKYKSSTRNELWDIRPQPKTELFGPPGPFYGNEYFHVLELTPIDSGYRAYVCDGMYDIFREGEQKGEYVSVIAYPSHFGLNDIAGMKVWRVEFTDTPPATNAPAPATAAQRGPNPAPAGDVFGPWHITGASDDKWGTMINSEDTADEEIDGPGRISQCSNLMPQWRTERDDIIKSVLDTPPAGEPASPGWPEIGPQ